MADHATVLDKASAALGRAGPLQAPVPPTIDQPIARLVHSDIGLPELFAKRAEQMKMRVQTCNVEDLMDKLIPFLQANSCKKIALPVSRLLDGLDVQKQLRDSGFDVRRWDAMTLDELYDYDCGI